jgi:hypothetical protein
MITNFRKDTQMSDQNFPLKALSDAFTLGLTMADTDVDFITLGEVGYLGQDQPKGIGCDPQGFIALGLLGSVELAEEIHADEMKHNLADLIEDLTGINIYTTTAPCPMELFRQDAKARMTQEATESVKGGFLAPQAQREWIAEMVENRMADVEDFLSDHRGRPSLNEIMEKYVNGSEYQYTQMAGWLGHLKAEDLVINDPAVKAQVDAEQEEMKQKDPGFYVPWFASLVPYSAVRFIVRNRLGLPQD